MQHRVSRLRCEHPAPSLSTLVRVAGCSLCALTACAADAVSIGAGDPALASEQKPECRSDATRGSVFTHTQREIDALTGCEEIQGALTIQPFWGMDLRPLRWLRIVQSTLKVGDEFVPVESLAGLEAVERVGGLSLTQLEVQDLSALASLRLVASAPSHNPLDIAAISIDSCNQLRNLRGLEQVTGWDELVITNSTNLESLDGLYVGGQMGRFSFVQLPNLRDLRALAPALRIERLQLVDTGLETLDGLEGVISMGELELVGNPSLRRLDGLSGLIVLQQMWARDNAVLEQLPPSSQLSGLRVLSIQNNPQLRSVPRYVGQVGSVGDSSIGAQEDLPTGFELVQIMGNSRLTEVALPSNHVFGQYVTIHDNQALTALDLGGLRSVDMLEIHDNAALSQLARGDLTRVDDLTVTNNPQLSAAVFDGVQTFTRHVSGNLPGAAP